MDDSSSGPPRWFGALCLAALMFYLIVATIVLYFALRGH